MAQVIKRDEGFSDDMVILKEIFSEEIIER